MPRPKSDDKKMISLYEAQRIKKLTASMPMTGRAIFKLNIETSLITKIIIRIKSRPEVIKGNNEFTMEI